MNYTYLPPSPTTRFPRIIMTTSPSSKKTLNLLQNPNVSLLVHDWVSSRPPNLGSGERERSPTGTGRSSSLATMLMQINSASVGQISATINGEARVLERGSEEERWCRGRHLEENRFDLNGSGSGENDGGFLRRMQSQEGTAGANGYIADEDVRVVVVRIRDGRVSDWKGGIKDFVLAADRGAEAAQEAGGQGLVNGGA
jgi:hypothetical protein